MYLSVIIPAHNEEKRIAKTLNEIDGYLSRQIFDYEILVVDNGSKDKTAEIVKGLETTIRGLRLIKGLAGKGKGFAVIKGMLEAKGDFRIFTDADNSTSLDQVEKMWPYLEEDFEVIIGSRDVKGAVLDPPQPFLRGVILGEGFKIFRKIILGLWSIEDTQCGFKGFTGRAAETIFPRVKTLDFAFDVEVLVIARLKGYKIKELPVHWKNDLASKVKFSSMVKMALDILEIKLNLFKKAYA